MFTTELGYEWLPIKAWESEPTLRSHSGWYRNGNRIDDTSTIHSFLGHLRGKPYFHLQQTWLGDAFNAVERPEFIRDSELAHRWPGFSIDRVVDVMADKFLAIGRFSQFSGKVMPAMGSRAWFEADANWRSQPRSLIAWEPTKGELSVILPATPGCNLLDACSNERTDRLRVLTYDESSRLLSLQDEPRSYSMPLPEFISRPLHGVLSGNCEKFFVIWLESADTKNFAVIDLIREEVTYKGSVGIREWAWIGSEIGDRVSIVTMDGSGGAQIKCVLNGSETILDEIRSFDEHASRVIGFRDGTIAVLANSFSESSKLIVSNSKTGHTRLVATGDCHFVDIGLNISEGSLLWPPDPYH
jgi:hypothetical protein